MHNDPAAHLEHCGRCRIRTRRPPLLLPSGYEGLGAVDQIDILQGSRLVDLGAGAPIAVALLLLLQCCCLTATLSYSVGEILKVKAGLLLRWLLVSRQAAAMAAATCGVHGVVAVVAVALIAFFHRHSNDGTIVERSVFGHIRIGFYCSCGPVTH